MTRQHRRETVFFIEWNKLPQEWKDYVSDKYSWPQSDQRFNNEVSLRVFSEMEPMTEGKDWGDTLTQERLEAYHKDQTNTNGYRGDLEQFIKDYKLEFEVWILDQGFDLTGVKTILIDISW